MSIQNAMVVAVIPARFYSTRLPQKMLADIGGKPMVQWVVESVKQAKLVDRVLVATDDERIAEKVRSFGGEVVMTSPELRSGTDRVAAVSKECPGDIFVNVQGDEPLLEPEVIDQAVQLVKSGQFKMASAMTPLSSVEELEDPACVKVIADAAGRAIYFSRYPIPFSRIAPHMDEFESLFSLKSTENWPCQRHLGLYVFSKETLIQFSELPPVPMERAESLEQLRALYHGISVGMVKVKSKSYGIDTAADLERARASVQASNLLGAAQNKKGRA